MGQQIFVAFVGFFGVTHAGVLAHGPEAAAIHGGLHAARERKLAGIAHVGIVVPAFKVGRGVERMRRNVFKLGGVAFAFIVLGH